MVDKLRKLLFAIETAENLDQLGTISGMEAASAKGRHEKILESDSNRKLAVDFPL
jgi:hypothetical protein